MSSGETMGNIYSEANASELQENENVISSIPHALFDGYDRPKWTYIKLYTK